MKNGGATSVPKSKKACNNHIISNIKIYCLILIQDEVLRKYTHEWENTVKGMVNSTIGTM